MSHPTVITKKRSGQTGKICFDVVMFLNSAQIEQTLVNKKLGVQVKNLLYIWNSTGDIVFEEILINIIKKMFISTTDEPTFVSY